MTTLTVSGRVAQVLSSYVSDVFGVMGNGNAYFLDAAEKQGLRFSPVRHEGAAIAAADAYYRASGRLAAGTTTYGPGYTNALTALAEAVQAQIPVVLVTGDNSREDYDEPDAMRAYLVRHGVPDARIVSDYAGFDTWDSCVRAKRIFGVDEAVLISQDFHIRRAVALCQEAGVTSYGVGVAARHDVTWYYGGVRELFAAGKAALDAVVEPDPRFLGRRETGVADALARAR